MEQTLKLGHPQAMTIFTSMYIYIYSCVLDHAYNHAYNNECIEHEIGEWEGGWARVGGAKGADREREKVGGAKSGI